MRFCDLKYRDSPGKKKDKYRDWKKKESQTGTLE